jgi:hypothetical protein
VDSGFGDDVRVEAVAKIDGVDIVTGANLASRVVLGGRLRRRGREGARAPEVGQRERRDAYHSKSLYIMVKKTWRKRLTAFISTANRYSQASPDIVTTRV